MASLYHVKAGQLFRIPDDDSETKCRMCYEKAKPDDGIDLGGLYEYGHPVVDPDGVHDVEVYCAHYFCLMFSSGLDQRGESEEVGLMGFLPADVLREWRRGRQLKCAECGSKSAPVGCSQKICKKTFHLPCAIRSGSLTQFCDKFSVFCADHRPRQKIFSSKAPKTTGQPCGICYEVVKSKNSEDPLWSPCCNKFFHRQCVQRFATSSGYFFKCPLCNNKDEFEREMKLFGIYVPEKDAAWEDGSNFDELYERHGTCDAEICLCDEGREKDVDYTEWEIVLCRCCGAKGIHVKCGGLSPSKIKWTCDFCKDVVKNLPPTVVHSFKPINRRKTSNRSKIAGLLKRATITLDGNTLSFNLPSMAVSTEVKSSFKIPRSVKVTSLSEKEEVAVKKPQVSSCSPIKIKIPRESTPPRSPASPAIKRLTTKSPKVSPKKVKVAKQQSILNYLKMK